MILQYNITKWHTVRYNTETKEFSGSWDSVKRLSDYYLAKDLSLCHEKGSYNNKANTYNLYTSDSNNEIHFEYRFIYGDEKFEFITMDGDKIIKKEILYLDDTPKPARIEPFEVRS